MRVAVLDVPYDCGHFDRRMGSGPLALLRSGLLAELETDGVDVRAEPVRLPEGFHTEWDALVSLQHQIAGLVRAASERGERALILSGNCGPAALGAIGALGGDRTAVVWCDAHGDFNTPESSPSGFLDGMALATAAGRCWSAATRRLEMPTVVSDDSITLVGARDLDAAEAEQIAASGITRVAPGGTDDLIRGLERLPATAAHLYLHVDMDVVDADEVRANQFAAPGGLGLDELLAMIAAIGRVRWIAAASLTALDPWWDPRSTAAARRVARALALA
ncbi:MAG TPA: arginase family protein [Vicinamibacterales bacterium]|nr:arginase family protein [Vicinamibacterales bacterium]